MALIKLAAHLTGIRNSVGSGTYTVNHYGNVLRHRVTPYNPQSSYQTSARAKITQLSQAWKSLTDAQRLAWGTLAASLARTNIFGESATLTGFNLYVKCNVNRLLMSQTVLSAAPTAAYGAAITSITPTIGDDGSASIVFAPTPVPTGNQMFIYTTGGLSAGKSYVESDFKFLAAKAAASASPADVGTQFEARYGAPGTGKKVVVRCCNVLIASGLPGPIIEASAVTS